MLAMVDDVRQRRPMRPPEPLVVSTSELASLVERWIEKHEAQHPPREAIDKVPYGRVGKRPQHYSAERYICDEADISPRRLQNIRRCEEPFTNFGVAEDVLHALEIPDEVTIYANPTWPRSRVERELEKRGVDCEQPFWEWEVP